MRQIRDVAEWVLDASAILAFVRKEPGRETVAPLLSESAVSANNLAEVASRLLDRGLSVDDVRALIDRLGLKVHSVDEAMAFDIGELRPVTRAKGLSLGDRSCLALARKLGLPAVTADRAWSQLAIDGLDVRLIR